MVAQVAAILLLILGHDHLQRFFVARQVALWVAMVTAVVSGVDYYRRFNHVLTVRTGQALSRSLSRPDRSLGSRHLRLRIASTRFCASGQVLARLELLDQPLVVGQRLGRALAPSRATSPR